MKPSDRAVRRARWFSLARLAGPMSRSPIVLAMAGVALAVSGATGLYRYQVDSGQDLLVGSNSPANQTYQRLVSHFGSDPIVVVFAARNPTAFYREGNILRLSALEDDLNHDPRVASALGPGTVANSLVNAAHQEEVRILTEYGTFIAELAYLNGTTDPTKLQQAKQTAEQIFSIDVFKAAVDAETARQQEIQREQTNPKPTDRVLDTEELAAEAAVAKDLTGPSSLLPPAFAQFLNYRSPDEAAASKLFQTVTAAYGDCDPDLASLVAQSVPNFKPTCKYLIYRALLNLPDCPLRSDKTFCQPKKEWAAVLPPPTGSIANGFPADCSGSPVKGCSYALLTIRLKPGVSQDRQQVNDLLAKIQSALTQGIPRDEYMSHLSATQQKSLADLKALQPTECAADTPQTDKTCFDATANAALSHVVAGAAPLSFAVGSEMERLLPIMVPIAVVLMLALLIGTFRVRGRVWPLVSALAATALTFGLARYLGTPLSPAVLAGIPVLVGVGVDYAVQLVARYAEERGGGAEVEAAAATALGRTGPATLLAALATIAGLLGLGLVTAVDGGALVAVPLVAQFALVVAGGVALSWLSAIFVALPLAIATDRRGGRPVVAAPAAATPWRILGLAGRPVMVLAPALFLGLLGWVLLPSTPIQTDSERLLAPSLPELQQINTARDQAGYANEIDVLLEGQVAGPYTDAKPIPDNVVFQCQLGTSILSSFPDQVAATTSIADFFAAARTGAAKEGLDKCTAPAPTANGSSTGTASPSPSPTARRPTGPVLARQGPGDDRAVATPPPSPVTTRQAGSGTHSPAATPSPAAGGGQAKVQTTLLCDLRFFPLLARTLIMDVPADAQACPGVDKFQKVFISPDRAPIDPTAARVVVGVRSSSVADEARVIDGIRGLPTPRGISAAPAGLAVLAAQAYSTISSRTLLFNLLPLVLVALFLFVVFPQPRRAVLALLPTVLAAGWGPLLIRALGILPGSVGQTLGALNPLTVVLGALVVALGTEFSVILLSRFYEELGKGLSVDSAAAATLHGVGRAIVVSAVTLGAGFAVLAVSGLLPSNLPLLADFGLAVLLDLALAVAAVFLVMFPLAIAWERASPVALSVREGGPMPVVGALGITSSQQVSAYIVGLVVAVGIVILGASLSPLCYLALLPLGIALVAATAGVPSVTPRPLPASRAPAAVPDRPPTSAKAARRRATALNGVPSRRPAAPSVEVESVEPEVDTVPPAGEVGVPSPGPEPTPEPAEVDPGRQDIDVAAVGSAVPPSEKVEVPVLPASSPIQGGDRAGALDAPTLTEAPVEAAAPAAEPRRPRRLPGVSGRRPTQAGPALDPEPSEHEGKRRPGVSGRPRRPRPGVDAAVDPRGAVGPAAAIPPSSTRDQPAADPTPAASGRRKSRRRRPPPGVRRRDRDRPPDA